jgi:uncharacterized LabA/DUF88 family protein
MKTYVYIDGFNLYYGAVKGTPYKWLDIKKLCEILLSKHQIARIKYFTARVSGRPGDPDQPTRQQMFLRALATLPDVEIIYGHFLTNETYMPLVGSPPGTAPKYAKVIKTEEKGSDVNLATHLMWDGFRSRYEAAVLVTNDSDLLEPVKIVRRELGLVVGILNPHKKASRVLAREASFVKQIRTAALKASQFPRTMKDAHGVITKPSSW